MRNEADLNPFKKIKWRFGLRGLFACVLLVVAFLSWRNYEIARSEYETNVAIEVVSRMGGKVEFSKKHRGKIERITIENEELPSEFFEVIQSPACRLKQLDLLNCSLIDCEAIAQMNTLQTLYLSNCDLREEDLRALAKMRELKLVNFEGSGELATEGLQQLVSNPNVREVWLSDHACKWKLKPHRNCRIFGVDSICIDPE